MTTNTYVELNSQTLSSAGTVTFSSIPQTYTDLVIVVSNALSTSGTPGVCLRLNGDTGTNYSITYIESNALTTPTTNRIANNTYINSGYNIGMSSTSGQQGIVIFNVMNYSNSSVYKTVLGRTGQTLGSAPGSNAFTGLWRNTAAVTSINLNAQGSNIAAGAVVSLYGIKAFADETTPKATGGYVYSDSTYWYHAFPFSGTFTPNQSLTADVLVIAGGGGGGNAGDRGAGGGGAGGLLAHTSQSLTATNYTCTVGGGAAAIRGGYTTVGNNGTNSQFAALTAAVGGGGGGCEGASLRNGANGGSGGGGGAATGPNVNGTGGTGTSTQGNNGGLAFTSGGSDAQGGGGGGASAPGAAAATYAPGAGGVGTSTYSSWGIATQTGENVAGTFYYAGGGGGAGGGYSQAEGGRGFGGYGGGGTGSSLINGYATNGMVSTGSGGGAQSWNGTSGCGGSGLIIVRYTK